MKKIPVFLFLAFILAACDTWGIPPQPFPVWTPIPSRTPGIVTATPLILLPPSIDTFTPGVIPASPTNTDIPSPTEPLEPPSPTQTFTAVSAPAVELDILGCNTGLDILHGMGEVTNAYVNIKNTGNVDLPNTCALLRAIDEDREHPDKKRCIDNLPAQHQVKLKLTVDSQYKVDTIIQVEVASSETVLLRVEQQSCRNISLFGGTPSDVNVVKPIGP
ncbi:MAG: hypothetical protein QY332_10960 [Anaerolineales bacterium]|nr:MAG: hypothetical protein QY332_10960 [Anaerolineales bacterium]